MTPDRAASIITIQQLTDARVWLDKGGQILQALNDSRPVEGHICEFGVWQGNSIEMIANAYRGHTIHGFDSFTGLPEAWHLGPSSTYQPGHFGMDGKLPHVPLNVELHKGWFTDSLPLWLDTHPGPMRFINIDSDLYQSAMDVLTLCNDRIQPGTIIYFDEIGNWIGGYPNWAEGELRALNDWCAQHGRMVTVHSRNAQYGAAVVVTQ